MTGALCLTTGLEVAANLANAVSILLAALNRVQTWTVGIVGCVLFGWLFASTQLYADALLQLFFIGTSIVGWRNWRAGNHSAASVVRRATPGELALSVGGAVLVTAVYGGFLFKFTNAFAPFSDSAVLGLSVVAQFLLMRRLYDTWFFWLAVNTIAVPLFLARGLQVTAVLYAAFWVNAVVALARWRKRVVA